MDFPQILHLFFLISSAKFSSLKYHDTSNFLQSYEYFLIFKKKYVVIYCLFADFSVTLQKITPWKINSTTSQT